MFKKSRALLAVSMLPHLVRAAQPQEVIDERAKRLEVIDGASDALAAKVQAADAADLADKIARASTADKSNVEMVIPSGRQMGKSLAMAELQERIFFKPALHASSKTRRPGENRAQHRARIRALNAPAPQPDGIVRTVHYTEAGAILAGNLDITEATGDPWPHASTEQPLDTAGRADWPNFPHQGDQQ